MNLSLIIYFVDHLSFNKKYTILEIQLSGGPAAYIS